MDNFGSANVRFVLLTVILLTLAFGGTLLGMAVAGDAIPDLVSNGFTTLLGVLVGTGVSIGAKPRVDAAQKALEAANVVPPVVTNVVASPAATAPTVAAPSISEPGGYADVVPQVEDTAVDDDGTGEFPDPTGV